MQLLLPCGSLVTPVVQNPNAVILGVDFFSALRPVVAHLEDLPARLAELYFRLARR